MELNKINKTGSKGTNQAKTQEEKNRCNKAIPRKFVNWLFFCLKELGIEKKNIKDMESLSEFSNFSGSLYNLVHRIEMANDKDFMRINLFINEVEKLYKKIFGLEPDITVYSKLDPESYEQSIKIIKFYWNLVKESFVYDQAAFFNGLSSDHDYKNTIKGFDIIIELIKNKKLKKESLDKVNKFIKNLGIDDKYYCCLLEALHSFINELCKTRKYVKLIDLMDILPDAIKEIKSSIKIFNLIQVDNGMKKATGVFKSDREFYTRYINIILLKSVLNSFEKNINKLFDGNEIILKSIKQMLIIVLETRISKEYLSKILDGDEVAKKVLSQIFYSLIKNEPIDKSFSLSYISSCCKTSNTKKPERYDFYKSAFCK